MTFPIVIASAERNACGDDGHGSVLIGEYTDGCALSTILVVQLE